jgi:hypothetical protein
MGYLSGACAFRREQSLRSVVMMTLLVIFPRIGMGQERVELSGTFSPAGPPVDAPERVDAGPTCIVDLSQRYEVEGDLAGRMDVDYRILVHGPCGAGAGTYDEEWIAHGTFDGNLDREHVSGNFVYTADVRSGGEVRGRMVFGGGIEGTFTILGTFSDQRLSYSGVIEGGLGSRDR